ncbi:MAG: 2-oxoacid:acceptor oxidoreductase family protein, partial [Muribaculaceae bacterium]|nr:2-oxoacid:acceptor oxidoreductase family protein [Muribaculaceae bacterium]
DKFESKVKPGGILIYDPYGIHHAPTRTDITVIKVEAMEATFEMENAKAYNMLLLGSLLKACPMVTIESAMNGLKHTLPERHHHLLPMNEAAIRRGMDLVN